MAFASLDYEQSLSFFLEPLSKIRNTQMATRVTEGARRERHEKSSLFAAIQPTLLYEDGKNGRPLPDERYTSETENWVG